MKVKGQEIKGPCTEILVLPRGEGQIVFEAQAILDFDEFDKLCPEPKPTGRRTKDGWEPNLKDKDYIRAIAHRNDLLTAYTVLKSLEPSEIEWDTVDVNDPKTWLNFREDFKNAGFSSVEVGRIIGLATKVNALDESKLEEARKVFLRGQRKEQGESSGLVTEQENTQSGKPVSE